MTRTTIVIIAALSFSQISGVRNRKVFAPTGCTRPTNLTYYFLPANSGCGTGTVCAIDTIAGNQATVASGGPTFSPSGTPFTGRPALSFSGSSNFLTMASTFSGTTLSGFIVFNEAADNLYLVGGTTGGAPGVRLSTANKFQVASVSTANVATGTNTISLSANHAYAFTVNSSTGTATFWSLSGGTATADTIASSAASAWTAPLNTIGGAATLSHGFLGAVGLFNGAWTSTDAGQAAALVSCSFGI